MELTCDLLMIVHSDCDTTLWLLQIGTRGRYGKQHTSEVKVALPTLFGTEWCHPARGNPHTPPSADKVHAEATPHMGLLVWLFARPPAGS